MSDIKNREHLENEISPLDKWKHFEENYGKKSAIGLALVLALILGYFGYKQYFLDPKEKQAAEAMFRAEEYFRADSIQTCSERGRRKCRICENYYQI